MSGLSLGNSSKLTEIKLQKLKLFHCEQKKNYLYQLTAILRNLKHYIRNIYSTALHNCNVT